MKLKEFDYYLPRYLIAQKPLKRREDSRLMVLYRKEGKIEHTHFTALIDYLQEGDVLVGNNTRVIPARLYGRKETGGQVELFLLRFLQNGKKGSQVWECLLRSRRRPRISATLSFGNGLSGEILGNISNGHWKVRLNYQGNFEKLLHNVGRTPLPHYIHRDPCSIDEEKFDRERYQTVYAARDGAVAAPTAGLHFSRRLLSSIKNSGIGVEFITLHVGAGTFQPIRVEDIEKHSMHEEFFSLSQTTAKRINEAKIKKGRIISIGTTTTRTLETLARQDGMIHPGEGFTNLFIYPGYTFKTIDAIITNFHLPRSSLLLLVCAFAGREFIFEAYREAIKKGYRFYSYGDAMFII